MIDQTVMRWRELPPRVKKEMAANLGMTVQRLSNLINGTSVAGAKTAMRIGEQYPWLSKSFFRPDLWPKRSKGEH